MRSVVARLARTGLKRGLLEGSRTWLYVGVTAAALQVVRRAASSAPETIYVGELKPGEKIEICTKRPKV
jgi:hypothetical protein